MTSPEQPDPIMQIEKKIDAIVSASIRGDMNTVNRYAAQLQTVVANANKKAVADFIASPEYYGHVQEAVRLGKIAELESMGTQWLKLGDPECGIAIDDRIAALRENKSSRPPWGLHR